MRRYPLSRAMLLIGILSFGAGCIEMSHDVRISPDGTVDYRLTYSITETAISQFKALDRLMTDLAEVEGRRGSGFDLDPVLRAFIDPRDDKLAAVLEPFKESGLIVSDLRVRSRDARRTVECRLLIRDLRLLADTEFFRKYGFDLRKEAEGRYSFLRRPIIDEALWSSPDIDAESRRQLELLLSGFRCEVQVTVPGRIIGSTAHRTRLHTATWEYTFATMPDVLLRLQKQAFRVVFESSGASLPDITYEGGLTR